ncbi:class I SAM-dependent methyltransferase [Sphingomonas profundi]|uniref:class I SAM-dependent methyltransferase n=1 Tax=Alterirhizorhabdus profundi TaxID=2681549 RepID=UPI0012E92663|nr:class I SAM-dependent methyltransferase [Sphingomonas profundi]
MTVDQHQETIGHYGPRASAYVVSAVHASGPDLDQLEALLTGRGSDRVLDLGCGGGHVSYRAAPHVGQVVACDVTPAMIAAVLTEAAERGIGNIVGEVAPAEALPFDDASFDAVLCRFTAHHWSDLRAGLAEARRVSKPGALLVFIDTVAPDDRASDTHLQVVEYLRDPSHVRNYSVAELADGLSQAGFAVESKMVRSLHMDFAVWTQRTNTPPDNVAMLRRLQHEAGAEVRRQLAIGKDGSFDLEAATFTGSAL